MNQPKYRQLLFILIANFLISPLLSHGIGSFVSSALLFYSIVLVVLSLPSSRRLRVVYLVIAAIPFSLQMASSFHWIQNYSLPAALLAQGTFALYLGVSAFFIMESLFTTATVTLETVEGGISVYFLVGYVWALFYGMIAAVEPGAFSQPLIVNGSFMRAIHFSFTTLTTLGYGDIVPISDLASVLTNLEAIIGQMYPAVFISILVGAYLSQRQH